MLRNKKKLHNGRSSHQIQCGVEGLEPRWVLSATGLGDNDCAPDLDLSSVATQQIEAGQLLSINLLDSGGTVVDLDENDQPTGDVIRLYLDPDVGTDTPTGASITTGGLFTWTPTTDQVGTHQIIVLAVDSGSPPLADAEIFIIEVLPANQVPTLDLNGSEAGTGFENTFTEDAGEVAAVDSVNLEITDGDDANLQSASATITNLLNGTDELLDVDTTGTNITAVYDSGTGILSLTGEDTVANYQLVLRTLTYDNASQNPDTTDRIIEVIVNDGTDDSATATATIEVNAVNDAPLLDLNGGDGGLDFSAIFTEDQGEVVIVDTDLSVTDVDNTEIASATVSITNLLDGDAEILAVNTTDTSIVASYDDTNGVLTLTGTAPIEDYQQVLRTLTYNNTSQNPNDTDRSIEVIVNDGTDDSNVTTTVVTVNGVNDAPQADPIADTNASVGQLLSVTVTATDPEGDNLTFTFDPQSNPPASATITKNSDTTAVIEWTPVEGDGAGPFVFTVIVTDDGSPAMADSESFTVTLGNDAPVVDLNGDDAETSFSAFFTEDGGAVLIVDTDLSVTDNDDANLESATVVITNQLDGTAEVLAVDNLGTNITAVYNDATGTLTLTGTESVENYQAVLRTLTYDNTSQDPDDTDRLIEVSVNDGTSDSNIAVSTVTVLPENDSPNLVLPGEFGSGSPVNVDVDTLVSFTATVTDIDNSAAEIFFILDLENSGIPDQVPPPSITSPPGTTPGGDFSWTPTQTGTFTITILVTDVDGLSDQETFVLNVVEAQQSLEGEPVDLVLDEILDDPLLD